MKRLAYFLCICTATFLNFACSDLANGFTSAGSDNGTSAGDEIVPDEIADNQIKVISFNVRTSALDTGTGHAWYNRKEACRALLKKENPTVFGVQEATPTQMSYFEANTGYTAIGVGRYNDGRNDDETTGIFYNEDRVTLEDWGVFWLSETPGEVSKGWDANDNRTATWALFTHKFTGKKVFFINTHLDNIGVEARKNSITLIVDKLAELNPGGYTTILTADFNSSTDDVIFDPLKAALLDARGTAIVTDGGNTYNNWGNGGSVIDHIFYSGLTIKKFSVIRDVYLNVTYCSDHWPISALFQFE